MAEILVCDDDKAIVEAIEIYLSQEGHHILKAGSLTVEYRKKPYEAYKKALFLSILLNLLVLVCARYDIIKRKEVFYVYKYHW